MNKFFVPKSVDVIGSLLKMSTLDVKLTGRTEESSLEGFGDRPIFQIDEDSLGTSVMSISGDEGRLGRLPGDEGDFSAIFLLFIADIDSRKRNKECAVPL